MDKVKVALEMIKKHHFWVLCMTVVVLGLMAWFTATKILAKQYEEKKGVLEGLFSSLNTITNRGDHPNDKVVLAKESETEKLKGDVFKSWQKLYKVQKEKNPWPPVLGEEFLRHCEDEEIPTHLRFDYMQFITQYVPTLFGEDMANIVRPKDGGEGVSAEPAAEPANPGPGVGAGPGVEEEKRPEVKMIGVVKWNEGDRKRLMAKFQWETTPSTRQVRLAQEDLWVYEALVRIIRNTNKYVGYNQEKKCTANHNANIKEITSLEIGNYSRSAGETVMEVGQKKASSGGDGPRTPSTPEDELLSGRYVDDHGKSVAPNKMPYAEYKIMPIRMKLVMNQMMIPKLLVECANSSMPIEVRRVRLRPDNRGLDLSAAPAGAGGNLAAQAAAFHMHGGRDDGVEVKQLDGSDIPVEISGFIYIYNPPDKDKLGTGAASEKPEPETEPGTEEPGTEEPGTEEPGTEESKPTETPAPPVTPAPGPTAAPGLRPGPGPVQPGAAPGMGPGAPAPRPAAPPAPGPAPAGSG